jgi:hypothetical protein
MLAMVLLSACSQVLSNYVRTDGAPVDAAQEKATLAQCKGEGATASAHVAEDPGLHRLTLEMKVTEACMARNGYILQQATSSR